MRTLLRFPFIGTVLPFPGNFYLFNVRNETVTGRQIGSVYKRHKYGSKRNNTTCRKRPYSTFKIKIQPLNNYFSTVYTNVAHGQQGIEVNMMT